MEIEINIHKELDNNVLANKAVVLCIRNLHLLCVN